MHFEASPQRLDNRLILRLPNELSDRLPSRGMVMARLQVEGQHRILPVEPDGKGGHWVELGDMAIDSRSPASIELEPVKDWPEPEMPGDIMEGIVEAGLLDSWNSLTVKARWEWLRWIRSTRSADTRAKHIRVACSKLASGMRRPCCFNAASCTVPELSRSGVLRDA